MKYLTLAFMLAIVGCAHVDQSAQTQSVVGSPYEHYLPQATPSETNRVEFPEGYSIVSPAGWTARTIAIGDFLKDYVADQIVIEGHETDEYPPRITIQHLGPKENAQFTSGQGLADGWTSTQFQGQPALSRFLAGYGSHRAIRGTCQPWLTQELFFECDGNGFILSFDMRNADKDEPYYKQPVPIIEQYFETFRYKAPKK